MTSPRRPGDFRRLQTRPTQHIFRLSVALLASIGWLAATAGPARADAAAPTNYESIVTGTDPQTELVTFEVVGGDSFLEVLAVHGHEVMIPGYFDEPYIRIAADSAVWINENSPAHYINRDRYGDVPIPEGVDSDADPQWVKVADDGRYAWHDHRVHWMSYDRPPTVDGSTPEIVFPWEVPFSVDDQEGLVLGQLVWIPSRSPAAPLLAGTIALLSLVIWGRMRVAPRAGLLGVAGIVAISISLTQMGGTPASTRVVPFEAILAIVAVACSGLALGTRKSRTRLANWAVFVGGLSLIAWAMANLAVLWMPVLPSTITPSLERAGVAFVIWAGLGVSLLTANSVLKSRPVLAKS